MAARKRFSRSLVTQTLRDRIAQLERTHGFHELSGWAQVEGLPTDIAVEYGRYEESLRLLEEWS